MNRFNNWLADFLGDHILSTMNFFWFCVILDLIELPPVIKSHSVITWCTYISQTVIQLVALPILAYQNRTQKHSNDELHAKMSLVHKHIKEIHRKVHSK